MLIKTDRRCGAKIQEDFAVAGEGAYLAQASLLNRGQFNMKEFEESVYAVWEAKKFAEGAPSVGPATSLSVLHKDGKHEMLSSDGILFFRAKHAELERKEVPKIVIPKKAFETLPPWEGPE
jgi:hypothetical protein